ncbi:MAG: uroporphyrinogen-III synthase [Methylococcales bacterium]|nr:uroporphyrinogen-III synthase [Methylococcales bacterium]
MFVSEKLAKYTLLVTRPKRQAESLCRLIDQQGWKSIRFPTLEIVALENNKINQQLEVINQYRWLIFISANAVNFALSANDGTIEHFKKSSIAAVGKATEKALHSIGLSVSLIPDAHFNSEGLLATKEMINVRGQACLIIRGKGGRETLANSLRERGAKVDYMEVYTREKPEYNDSNIADMLRQGTLNIITITSGEGLNNLMAMIAEELHDKLVSVPIIVISHRIKKIAEKIGFKHISVTEKPGDTAIIETAIKMRSQQNNNWGRV